MQIIRMKCLQKSWLFFLIILYLPTLVSSQNLEVLWKKAYNLPHLSHYDRFYSIKPISDNEFICVGETFSYGGNQAWVARIDPDTTIKWDYPYGGNTAHDVLISDDGNYIVVGDLGSPLPVIQMAT